MTLVPLKIEPYLVPYLFEKYKGSEASYRGVRVKKIRILQHDSLGKYIRLVCDRINVNARGTEYNIFLSVSKKGEIKGSVFTYKDGRHSFLAIPEREHAVINRMIEDEFFNSFYFFVEGYYRHGNAREGIRLWIERYHLDEFDIKLDRLEKHFHRKKKLFAKNRRAHVSEKVRNPAINLAKRSENE